MRKLLCLVALGLALAPSPRAQQPAAPPPAVTCDEMKAQFYGFARDGSRTPERMRQNYEAAKKLLRVCGGSGDEFTSYVAKWIEKYDRAVLEFEAGRDGGALGVAAGEEMMKGLTQGQ